MNDGIGELGIAGLRDATLVGQGGSGRVYRAYQEPLDRWVAVKVIPTFGEQSIERRFERERRALGRLSTIPGVVTVYQSGTTRDGDLYLLMPFVPGGSLKDSIEAGGRLGWEHATRIIEQAAASINEAHEAGVLHRDIKPGNILLDADGRPLISDFGIAQLGVETWSATASALTLTPAFSPPEAFEAGDGSAQADVYSLGATLWALIAGRPPFTEDSGSTSLSQLVGRIVSKAPGDLASIAPRSVCDVINKAMAKDPLDRQTSADELATELSTALTEAAGFAAPDPAAAVAGWASRAPAIDELSSPDEPHDRGAARAGRQRRSPSRKLLAGSLLAIAAIAAAVFAMQLGGDGDSQNAAQEPGPIAQSPGLENASLEAPSSSEAPPGQSATQPRFLAAPVVTASASSPTSIRASFTHAECVETTWTWTSADHTDSHSTPGQCYSGRNELAAGTLGYAGTEVRSGQDYTLTVSIHTSDGRSSSTEVGVSTPEGDPVPTSEPVVSKLTDPEINVIALSDVAHITLVLDEPVFASWTTSWDGGLQGGDGSFRSDHAIWGGAAHGGGMLEPGTTYSVSIEVWNQDGTRRGSDTREFTTADVT